MIRHQSIAVVLITCVLGGAVFGQSAAPAQDLFSPITAQAFQKIAYELYSGPDAGDEQARAAVVFLEAAQDLDRAQRLTVDLLLALSSMEEDQSERILPLLREYAGDRMLDLEVARRGIDHLLEHAQTREDRESRMAAVYDLAISRNDWLAADAAVRLSALMREKADFEMATGLLVTAHERNPYDHRTFVLLEEALQPMDQVIKPEGYLRHYRRLLQADPMDLDHAVTYAGALKYQEMYELASQAYTYAANLHKYVNRDEPLPAAIYLPWALSCYNSQRSQAQCVAIAAEVRESGRFDLVLEGIAVRAAQKTGNEDKARELQQAAVRAENLLSSGSATADVKPIELAWFYSFAAPNAEKALAWANRTHSANGESEMAKAIFAYALTMNSQPDLAVEYLGEIDERLPIATVARGLVLLSEGKKQEAIERWKAAVDMDPTSLVAERARRLLEENGSEYISTATPNEMQKALEESFRDDVVPTFRPTGAHLSAKFNLSGTDFSYGRPIDVQLIVQNESPSPMVILDDGLFTGRLRIDARLRGDLTMTIPAVISKTVRPASPISAGRNAIIPLDVVTGPLEEALMQHPQADLEIELIAYLDPVADADGKIRSGIPGMEPVRITIQREGVQLTQAFLIQRMDSLTGGQQGQQIRAAQLFVGLLAEQQAMGQQGALYRYLQVEPSLLVDAVRRGLNDDNWKVQVQTMATMLHLPGPMRFELASAVSSRLQGPSWPVRLTALFLLGQAQGERLQPVLDWTAQYDGNAHVRDMALALGASPQK